MLHLLTNPGPLPHAQMPATAQGLSFDWPAAAIVAIIGAVFGVLLAVHEIRKPNPPTNSGPVATVITGVICGGLFFGFVGGFGGGMLSAINAISDRQSRDSAADRGYSLSVQSWLRDDYGIEASTGDVDALVFYGRSEAVTVDGTPVMVRFAVTTDGHAALFRLDNSTVLTPTSTR